MNPSRRPLAVALAASAFYAGVFVTAAHAEMHYVRVTLVTGQQLTITVEVPPGTPVDQIQIPGLPAAVSSIVDLGSTETTPTPTATQAPTVTATPTDAHGDRRRPRARRAARARRRPRRRSTRPRRRSRRPPTRRPTRPSGGELEHRVADGQGRGGRQGGAEDRRRRQRRQRGRRHLDARGERPVVHARRAGRGQDRRPELLHRPLPDPAVPAADLPGRGHAVRRPLGAAGRDQRDRDRLRPQPARLHRGRPGLDAVHAGDLEVLRRRRQQRRPDGPVQPGRRDLRRRALPEGRRRRQGHPRRDLRLQPRRLVRGLGAAARAADRRPAVQPRRLAHGPDRGPLPGRRAGELPRRGHQAQPQGQGRQPCSRTRGFVQPDGHQDLRRRRLAGRRRQRRAGDPDRREPSGSASTSRSRTRTATRTRTGS